MLLERYLTLWYWIDALILAFAKVYLLGRLANMLGKIKINKVLYQALCILLLIIHTILEVKSYNLIVLFIVGIGSIWIMLSVSYEASVVQRWVVIVSWVTIVVISVTLVQSIIYGIYIYKVFKDTVMLKVIYSIGVLATVIILNGQIKIYQQLEVCIVHNKWVGGTALLPLVINSFSLILMFSYLKRMNFRGELFAGALLYLTIGLLIANITIVMNANKVAIFYEAEVEHRIAQKRLEEEYKYYSKLEEEQERIKLLYHDINNHIACIKELVKQQDELTQYITDLEREVQTTTQVYKTGCSVVDAILRQKSILCQEKQIDLRVNLNLMSCNFIEDKDLCSIFANVLDNAIEACEKIENLGIKKYIELESQVTQGFLVIRIKNSKEHRNMWVDERLITQKKDKWLHGLGLRNIKRSLEKYDGNYIIKEETNEFYLKLVLPVPMLKV